MCRLGNILLYIHDGSWNKKTKQKTSRNIAQFTLQTHLILLLISDKDVFFSCTVLLLFCEQKKITWNLISVLIWAFFICGLKSNTFFATWSWSLQVEWVFCSHEVTLTDPQNILKFKIKFMWNHSHHYHIAVGSDYVSTDTSIHSAATWSAHCHDHPLHWPLNCLTNVHQSDGLLFRQRKTHCSDTPLVTSSYLGYGLRFGSL